MGRHASADHQARGFTIQERRWMLHELNRLANAEGLVYERDLKAWWIGRLLIGRHAIRIAPGVLRVVKPVKIRK